MPVLGRLPPGCVLRFLGGTLAPWTRQAELEVEEGCDALAPSCFFFVSQMTPRSSSLLFSPVMCFNGECSNAAHAVQCSRCAFPVISLK